MPPRAMPLFVESLKLEFLHLTEYRLSPEWNGTLGSLPNNVLWYIREGTCEVAIGKERQSGGSGCLFLLPAGSRLSYRSTSEVLELTSINFSASISLFPGKPWSRMLNLPQRFENLDANLEPIINRMTQASLSRSFSRALVLQAGLQLAVAELLERIDFENRCPTAWDEADYRILKLVRFIAESGRIPSASAMAEAISISPSHLRKLCRLHLELSPLELAHRIKIDQAQALLKESERLIAEIAWQLGYRDPNYFARLFKEKTGCSPTSYRMQFRL
ncbi:AraC family transcriptional regulator [Cohnella suwonensis]|uniref:AraC family transcriptional regulator n=1 Tax=Cohnella suwonensis TaxID=696072 RepID=A0ABW0LT57_9BACL